MANSVKHLDRDCDIQSIYIDEMSEFASETASSFIWRTHRLYDKSQLELYIILEHKAAYFRLLPAVKHNVRPMKPVFMKIISLFKFIASTSYAGTYGVT